MQDSKGLRYSAILHGVMLFFMIFGLPEFLEPRPIPEPVAISVDILPIAPISNVKPQEKPPEKIEKKPVADENTAKKATPDVKKPEPKPEAAPIPEPKKPDVKKPEQKKKEEKKPEKKEKEDPLKKILQGVAEDAKKEGPKDARKKPAPQQNEAKSDRYDPAMPLSMSETDAIRQQFEKCWDAPAGAKDAHNLVVTIFVELNEDGSVIRAERKGNDARYASDSFYRAAADSALRAVHRCSPLKNLPTGKYSTWREMELSFDPRNLF